MFKKGLTISLLVVLFTSSCQKVSLVDSYSHVEISSYKNILNPKVFRFSVGDAQYEIHESERFTSLSDNGSATVTRATRSMIVKRGDVSVLFQMIYQKLKGSWFLSIYNEDGSVLIRLRFVKGVFIPVECDNCIGQIVAGTQPIWPPSWCESHPGLLFCAGIGDPNGPINNNCCALQSVLPPDVTSDCFDGCSGGGGSSGGVGDGNGFPYNPSNPCEFADSLATNASFRQKMSFLESKTNDNKEYAFVFTIDSNKDIVSDSIVGMPDSSFANIPVSEMIDGMIHSHFEGLLSIFSADDVFTIVDLFNEGKILDVKRFSIGLVTEKGSRYLLMINNLAEFQNFADPAVSFKTFATFTALYDLFQIKNDNSVDLNELRFLQLMNHYRTGLKLFKGNEEFNDWKPIKVNSDNQIVEDPC